MSGRCRYLDQNNRCAYWDEQLTDAETIRCEGPGGWSENCYVEDSRGAIYGGDWYKVGNEWRFEGKWMTLADFFAAIKQLPEYLEEEAKNIQLDDVTIKFLTENKDYPDESKRD